MSSPFYDQYQLNSNNNKNITPNKVYPSYEMSKTEFDYTRPTNRANYRPENYNNNNSNNYNNYNYNINRNQYYTQINNNNREEFNYGIYSNLLRKFESHLLSDPQKNSFINYMKNNCDSNFTRDMLYFLEDYNSLINQSIQAIKSLMTENMRLNQNNLNTDYSINNLNTNHSTNNNFANNPVTIENINNISSDYNSRIKNKITDNIMSNINQIKNENNQIAYTDLNNNNNLQNNNNNIFNPIKSSHIRNNYSNNNINQKDIDMENNNEFNVKRPLREKIRKLSNQANPNKKFRNNSTFCLKGRLPFNISYDEDENKLITKNNNKNYSNVNVADTISNRKINNNITNVDEINILKITNEILKLIEITQKNKKLFSQKYIKDANIKNIEENYRDFLQNIIDYKYNFQTLNNIYQDILTINKSCVMSKNNSEKNSFRNKQILRNKISEKNFRDNLRIYDSNNTTQSNNNIKPFVQFTNPYGKLFSREKYD